MQTILSILEAAGTFVVALATRFGVFLATGLLLALPALAAALAWRSLARRRAHLARTDGLSWRRGAYYAPNHTWLAARGPGELSVGLDDLARRILPSATAVELPRPGLTCHRGDPIAVVRAGRHVVHIGAPVDGRVVHVNRRVRRDPELVRREPYGAGWLFTLAPDDAAYMRYPHGGEAETWLRSERMRLSRFVEGELGLAAADGGEVPAPGPATLGEEGWKRVVHAFLHAA